MSGPDFPPVPSAEPAPHTAPNGTAQDMAAVTALSPAQRVFLMLQGPHGPFFDRVGGLLREAGAQVWRAGFNAGDEFFWSDKAHFIRHEGRPEEWPAHLERIITEKGITDIVL